MGIKKILILGGDGMAGSMAVSFLREKGHDVHITTRNENNGKSIYFDVLENYKDLEIIIEKINPQFVVNCIGVLNQYAEKNKTDAVLINSFLPHYIDSLSNKLNFKLIHISTDCVFEGERGNYVESDLPNALSFYGRTKALGEINNDRNLTFRTSIVGPDINPNGIGLFNWFLHQEVTINGFSRVIWTGVTTLELARAIEKSFDLNITGLYHLVNNEKINKYELLRLFKKYTNKNINITEDDSLISDKSLINSRKDFDFEIPDYNEMIEEMCKWINNHKK